MDSRIRRSRGDCPALSKQRGDLVAPDAPAAACASSEPTPAADWPSSLRRRGRLAFSAHLERDGMSTDAASGKILKQSRDRVINALADAYQTNKTRAEFRKVAAEIIDHYNSETRELCLQ